MIIIVMIIIMKMFPQQATLRLGRTLYSRLFHISPPVLFARVSESP